MSESAPTPTAGVLARRIAHDLRTPMGVIAGVLDELAEVDGAAAMVTLAQRSVQRLAWLARRLDWLAVATSTRTTNDDGALADAATIVRAAAHDALAVASRRGVTLSVNAVDGAWVSGPRALQHACEELLHNALRHARAQVELHMVLDGDGVRVVVADDGPGVAPERVAMLFEPPTTTPAAVGLWLAQRLATDAGSIIRHIPGAFVIHIPTARKPVSP